EGDRLIEPEKTQITHLLEKRVRGEDLIPLPLIDVRIDLGGDELLQAAPQLLVLVRELHVRFLMGKRPRLAARAPVFISNRDDQNERPSLTVFQRPFSITLICVIVEARWSVFENFVGGELK